MSLSNCPDCGNPVSSDATACPKCGRLTGRNRLRAFSAVPAIVVGILIVVGIFAVLGSFIAHQGRFTVPNATNRKAVHSGQKEQVAFFYDLRADCEVEGYPEITLVRLPAEGDVSTEPGMAFPEYRNDNIRFSCDRNQAGATLIFYKSKPDFRGHDQFTVKIRFPDSTQWTESYILDVL